MKQLTLTCAHCNAPLEVHPEARQLICSFCAARLVIAREASGAKTIVHDVPSPSRLPGVADGADDDVKPEQLRVQIEELDEHWLDCREQFRIDGTPLVDVPDTGRVVAMGMAIITVGVILTVVTAVNTSLWTVAPLGVIFLSIAVHYLVKGISRSQNYEDAYNDFRDRRIDLFRRLSRIG